MTRLIEIFYDRVSEFSEKVPKVKNIIKLSIVEFKNSHGNLKNVMNSLIKTANASSFIPPVCPI